MEFKNTDGVFGDYLEVCKPETLNANRHWLHYSHRCSKFVIFDCLAARRYCSPTSPRRDLPRRSFSRRPHASTAGPATGRHKGDQVFGVARVLSTMTGGGFAWWVLLWGGASAAATGGGDAAATFHAGLQQQSFLTILTSIEERLKNLDKVYSMQLSQTLSTKLDLYSRRLDSLDTKIIRLEALVMLNLDKISENISTKNFKDDISKTNTMRKLDSAYEGISHRLNYMDRKYEANFAKAQTKMDLVLMRLEKIEESVSTKDSDAEAEISDAIFAIDDLKTAYSSMEGKLQNFTTLTLNATKGNFDLLHEMFVENRKAINRLHDNIIDNLQYMDNRTVLHRKTVQENNVMLKTMRMELKEDFNDYANKVADMNSYIWKNSDTTGEDLKNIASAVNGTRIEVQNGVRSLMLQIGKLSSKNTSNVLGSSGVNEINKKLTTNFEKILSNQDLFLESCHRVQMDESQIESEISDMLEKLIDMLEKKMASETKDIKSLEKTLKNHDGRVNRNLYQANNNIISLFEKSNLHDQETKTQMRKIDNVLEALFAFVQSVMPYTANTKVILDKLQQIEHHTNTSIMVPNIQNDHLIQLQKNIETISKTLESVELKLNTGINEENIEPIFNRISQKYLENRCTVHNETTSTIKTGTSAAEIDEDTRKAIADIFGSNPDIASATKSPEVPRTNNKCKQNYRDLIDVRLGGENCENDEESTGRKKKERKGKKNKPDKIDIRGGFNPDDNVAYENYEGGYRRRNGGFGKCDRSRCNNGS
ncbi:hypothetical protein NQ318_019557 [Aromia moschata]|uniref:Uncharacterized protein n=1 Tax=Aromia moschata TaxID=1265417 RepID=A0AAV8Z3U7_9CUCU|nr:hypothetical protein NQ318_019557 [Aromia moschata]